VDPTVNQTYVANGDGTVSILNGATATVLVTLTAGTGPDAVAVNPSTGKVYVANAGSNTVTVINSSTNSVTATLPTGTTPSAIVADPISDKIYIANRDSNNMTVINGATDTVTGTVAVGTSPSGIAMNPVLGIVYVANTGSNNISVINESSLAVTTVAAGTAPAAVAVNIYCNTVFVTNGGSNTVTLLNGVTNATTATVVGNSPQAVAVNPITNRAYIANSNSGSITIVQGAGTTVMNVNTAQQGPSAEALDPTNHQVWVANSNGTLSVIATANNSVVTTITGVANPIAIASNATKGQMYVLAGSSLLVYSTAQPISSTPVATIPIPGWTASSGFIAVNPTTNRLYACQMYGYTKAISVLDISAYTVVAQFDANGPTSVTVDPVTNEAYVTIANTSTVDAIGAPGSAFPDAIKATINVSGVGNPTALAVNTVTNKVFVGGSNGISVINGSSDTVSITLNSSNSPNIGSNFNNLVVITATNQVIAGRAGYGALSVINGSGGDPETYTVNPASLQVAGGTPLGAGVYDPVTNKIYFADINGTAVTIIDATDLTNSYTVTVGQSPTAVVLDPATGQVYVANSGSNFVSVINPGKNAQTAPVTTALAGVTDSNTIVDPANPSYFKTSTPTPSFTAAITAVGTSPNSRTIYYTVDGASHMSVATAHTTNGQVNTFTFPISSQQTGEHMLFVYPAFGDEGGTKSASSGTGNSPFLGTVATLPFTIVPGVVLGTTTQVTATPNPQDVGSAVTLTATVVPESVNNGVYPTGTVTFTDELGNTLGSGTLPASNTGVVTITTTALSSGPHIITASYPGNSNFTTSSGTAPVMISLSAVNIIASQGQPQTILYGGSFSNLIATVTDASNSVVAGAQVSFSQTSGSGLSFSPATVTTNGQGQAETAITLSPQAVGTYTVTATLANNGATATYTLTVTPAPLQVVADPKQRNYGALNPSLTYTYSGFVNGDTATVVSGTPALATTAVTSSPIGSYPITVDTSGMSAANYTLTGVNGTLTVSQALTTVTLGVSPASVVYGNAATLTATVSAGATGTVSFYQGSTLLGTATVSGSTATLPISNLPAGTHNNLTAVYSGDSNFAQATSAAQLLTVTPAPLQVIAAAASRTYGQPNPEFTFSYAGFVNGDTPAAVSGSPALTTTAMQNSLPGNYPIAANVSGMSATNYILTGVPSTLTVSQATATVALGVSPATVMYGDPSTLTATVIQGATGTVSFYEGTTLLGTSTVNGSGIAVLPVGTLPVGVHTITAVYNGDSNFLAMTSLAASLTVIQRTAPDGGPGLIITVNNATRTSTETNPPFSYSVAGQLYNGDTYATAISGTPSYATAAGTTPGDYAVTLSGLTSTNYSVSFLPGTLTVTTTPTSTTLVASPSTSQYGDPVTLTASVSPAVVTGTVSFYNGAILLGSSAVSGGTATLVTSTLNAGTHTITAIYNGDVDYASSTSTPQTVTVTKKTAPGGGAALTVTVQNQSRTYGSADPEFNYAVTGTLINGDTYSSAVTGVPVYSSSDTPTSSAGSTFPISVSGLDSANYSVNIVNGTLTIVSAPSQTTLTANAVTVQYGTPITLTATVLPAGATGQVSFINGPTLHGTATITGGVATLTTSLPAGTYTITANYLGDTNFGSSTSSPINLTVTPAPLTVTVQDASRLVNQGNPPFNYVVSGQLYNGDTYATAVTGVPVYSTTALPSSLPGEYPIVMTGGLQSGNYSLTYMPGTLAVGHATSSITLSVMPATMVYGNTSTLSATVTAGSTGTITFYDGSTVLGTGNVGSGGAATLTTGVLGVGTYNILAAYSGDASNSPATSDTKALTVTPASLIVSAAPQTRTYGNANPPLTYTYSGFVNGETVAVVSGTPGLSTTATIESSPGSYPIAISVSGMLADNYIISGLPNILTVTQIQPDVTLSISPAQVMYGDPSTLTAEIPSGATGTVSFYEGTTLLGIASVNSTAGVAAMAVASLGVGTHNITAKYNGDVNYAGATSTAQTLTVIQRTGPDGGPGLIVTVNNASRTSTETNPPFSYSVAGQLYNGDTYATAISGTPSYATTAGSTPGDYAVAISGLTSANYSISFVPGNLTVTTTPTTTALTASPFTSQYGDPVTLTASVSPAAGTGTISFFNGSILLGSSAVSGGTATLVTSTLNAGTHTITAIYNGDVDYASSTSTPQTIAVTKKAAPGGGAALTVTVQNQSRTYGTANPQFSYIASGTLINGDTYTNAITGVPVYSSTDTPTSPAGSTFPISVSGTDSANYTVSFVNGTLTITPADSQISLGVNNNSVTYGTPVTLTSTVTPAGATGKVTFSSGSTVLGVGTISGSVATLTTSLPAGTYTITASYLGDTNFGSSTSLPLNLTVTPAPLTVTVQDVSRPTNQGNPAFGYVISGQLYNGDTYATAVTGVPVYSTTALPSSPPGQYPIVLTGGLQSSNYELTYVAGTLTVGLSTSSITLSITPATMTYGNSATLTAMVPAGNTGTIAFHSGSNLLGTVNVGSNGTASLATGVLAVGTYDITAVYSGDINNAPATSSVKTVTVTPASLMVSASPQNRLYGETNPALTYTYVGFVNGETASVVSGTPVLATTAIPSSPPGSYPITVDVSGMSAGNYTISGLANVLIVTQVQPAVTLSVNPAQVMYGDPSTLTAHVPTGATGTVSFYEGTTLLGIASVNSAAGIAAVAVNSLGVGTHNITAKYNGDVNYAAATSTPAALTVTQRTGAGGGPAITILVSDATRTTTQQNPVFSYQASGDLVNGDTYATAISGTPAYSTSAGNSPGIYTIALAGLTSSNYSLTIVPGTLTVVFTPTTTVLTANPSSVQYGSPITLTATVNPVGATGSVCFYDGNLYLGCSNLISGTATLAVSSLDAGSHSITAIYNGDGDYATSKSGPQAVQVTKKTAPGGGAALTVTIQNASRQYGTANPQFTYILSGDLVNGDTYASAVTGVPVYTSTDTPGSPTGSTFPISVNGLSSANYTLAFVNGTLTITPGSSQTSLAISNNAVTYGTAVTLTAKVTPSVATGRVDFSSGSIVLGSGTVSGGVATLTTVLPAGTYTITAMYLGDTDFGSSTSDPVNLTVAEEGTSGGGTPPGNVLTVTVNNANRLQGQGNPYFTYSITGALLNGDTYATAVTGQPVYRTTATVDSPVGTYPVTIVGGLISANYRLSFVSGTLTVTPNAGGLPDFSIKATPASQFIPPGASASYTVQLAPLGSSFDGSIGLTVAGLPSNATYSFNPAAVTPGQQSVASTLTINVPKTQARLSMPVKTSLLAALLLLPLTMLRRRRLTSLLAVIVTIAATGMSGCGAGGYFSQPEQTYTVTITGTSGTLVHSTTVTLTVQ
jgi:YVTN family beta-propeller protein